MDDDANADKGRQRMRRLAFAAVALLLTWVYGRANYGAAGTRWNASMVFVIGLFYFGWALCGGGKRPLKGGTPHQ